MFNTARRPFAGTFLCEIDPERNPVDLALRLNALFLADKRAARRLVLAARLRGRFDVARVYAWGANRVNLEAAIPGARILTKEIPRKEGAIPDSNWGVSRPLEPEERRFCSAAHHRVRKKSPEDEAVSEAPKKHGVSMLGAPFPWILMRGPFSGREMRTPRRGLNKGAKESSPRLRAIRAPFLAEAVNGRLGSLNTRLQKGCAFLASVCSSTWWRFRRWNILR